MNYFIYSRIGGCYYYSSLPQRDTIFALSTAPGKSAVSVIRLSGPLSLPTLALLTNNVPSSFNPSQIVLKTFRKPKEFKPESESDSQLRLKNDVIDTCYTFYSPAPKTFTGEDVVEFQTHGSPAVIKLFLETLSRLEGLRQAEPGEFTRRALRNNKLDYTQAEGLKDLINSNTEAQRIQAQKQMSGQLSKKCNEWRQQILKILANVEAIIDFDDDLKHDESNDTQSVENSTKNQIERLRKDIQNQIRIDGKKGEMIREGLKLCFAGQPNVGKSSLFNFLSNRKVSIVSSTPGTTRDVIETCLEIKGYPVVLADTAGIRSNTQGDEIEKEGQNLALERWSASDLKIWVIDPLIQDEGEFSFREKMMKECDLIVLNKLDLWQTRDSKETNKKQMQGVKVSCKTGEGMEGFIEELGRLIKQKLETVNEGEHQQGGENPNPGILVTRERHREALRNVIQNLSKAQEDPTKPIELVAEDLRLAVNWIGSITGKVQVDDILDIIFRDFCIGK